MQHVACKMQEATMTQHCSQHLLLGGLEGVERASRILCPADDGCTILGSRSGCLAVTAAKTQVDCGLPSASAFPTVPVVGGGCFALLCKAVANMTGAVHQACSERAACGAGPLPVSVSQTGLSKPMTLESFDSNCMHPIIN